MSPYFYKTERDVCIEVMRPKTSLVLALVCLFLPLSNFAASISVPPSAGGEGIQTALDSLSAGGEVVLCSGQYLIREPIQLRQDSQTLRGCGALTVLSLADQRPALGRPVHRWQQKEPAEGDLAVSARGRRRL